MAEQLMRDQKRGIDLVQTLEFFRCVMFRLELDFKEEAVQWVVYTLWRHYKRLHLVDAVLVFDVAAS